MNRRRVTPGLLALGLGAVLSGCGGGDDPPPVPSLPPTSSASSSVTPSPTPQSGASQVVAPAAGKDAAGAKAFGIHVVALVDRMARTGDSAEFERLSLGSCEECRDYARAAADMRANLHKGLKITTSPLEVKHSKASLVQSAGKTSAQFNAKVRVPVTRFEGTDGSVEVREESVSAYRYTFDWVHGEWRIAEVGS